MARSKKKTHKKPKTKKLPADVASARSLIKASFVILSKNWKLFLTFLTIYGLFVLVLVQGPSAIGVNELKDTITASLPDQANNATLIAGVLVGESADISQAAAAYGTFLFLIFSMAMIWLLRATYEGKKVLARDGFYKGMYGLIPVTLVFAVIILQMFPVAFGGLVYSIISLNGLAVNAIETSIVWIILGGLILWSLYMLSSSIQAIYIASLPETTPLVALRQAKKLVNGRRFKVMTRILVGAFIYGLIAFAGLLLVVAVLPAAATYWWWLVGIVALPVGHTYLYSLYRSLM